MYGSAGSEDHMTTTTTPNDTYRNPLLRQLGASLASTALTGVLMLVAVSCSGGQTAETASSTSRGAELYASNCASCHGADLRGTDRGPSQLSIVYEPSHHPDDSYRSAIANGAGQHHWGFGDMPPVPGLDDADVDEIIEFIRAVQRREGFEPYERP
jgi:mono/diheme cytochrome c family protein